MPDVAVDIHPDQLARGEDPQLEKAVDVLLEDVAAWRRSRTVSPAVSSGPGNSAPMPKTSTGGTP
jgi:hypothetical protein